MVAVNQQLESTLEQAVADMGLEWVGCEWAKDSGQTVLRVYLDTEGGISLDQCAQASREIGAILDVEDFLPSAYRLEVSSPGIDRPLFRIEHYAKQIGQRVSLKLKVPTAEGQRRVKGVIQSVEDQKVLINVDDKEDILELACSQIEKANVKLGT